jgi:hypothetical protein
LDSGVCSSCRPAGGIKPKKQPALSRSIGMGCEAPGPRALLWCGGDGGRTKGTWRAGRPLAAACSTVEPPLGLIGCKP